MQVSGKPWLIRFRFLPEDDAVLAEFDGVDLNTPEDVHRWAREVDTKLRGFGRKVDLIINLDGLRVKPAASREFGKCRAEVLATHSKSSYRFGGDRSTLTSVHTSAVLQQAAANVYGSFEDARTALHRARAMNASSSSSSSPSSSPASSPRSAPASSPKPAPSSSSSSPLTPRPPSARR